MAWETPKTDWHGSTDSEGIYTGDRFNAMMNFRLFLLGLTVLLLITFMLMKSISSRKI